MPVIVSRRLGTWLYCCGAHRFQVISENEILSLVKNEKKLNKSKGTK